MKGFNLANVGGSAGQPGLTSSTPSLAGSSTAPALVNASSRTSMQTLNETNALATIVATGQSNHRGNPLLRSPITKLAQLARLAGAKKADSKKKWGNLIEAAKSAKGVGRMWARSRSRSEDSVSSDGSGGTAAQTPVNTEGFNRREKFLRSRTGHPVVHVTENELPEVLEESCIDYELSGRMGIETVNGSHSPTFGNPHFRRACSEPADQITLILEAESPNVDNKSAQGCHFAAYSSAGDSANAVEPLRSKIDVEQPTSGVSLRFRKGADLTSPISFKASVTSRDWMAGHNLPDNLTLPFVDDSTDTITSSGSPMETVLKSVNGLSSGVHDGVACDDPICSAQSLESSAGGGWL